MQIADVLGSKGIGVIALLPDTDVASATLLLSEQGIGVAVVMEQEEGMVGILSERDIIRGLAEFGASVLTMEVENLMTRGVISVRPETRVEDALAIMQDKQIRHLPVLEDDNSLIAMVSIRDLVEAQSIRYPKAS